MANQDTNKKRDYFSERSDIRKPFTPLDDDSLKRNEELFVRPTGLPEEPADSRQRIFLIVGENGSGRRIAAINFALKIAEKNANGLRINIYQSQGTPLYDLNNIISHPHFERNAIYIVPDVFTHNLRADALSLAVASAYRIELQRQNAYLILTTTQTRIAEEVELAYAPMSTAGVDNAKVLRKHLDLEFSAQILTDDPVVQLLEQSDAQAEILKDLKTPKQIGILFQNLRQNPPDPPDRETLKVYIQRVAKSETSTIRSRFRDLDLNARTFSLLVALMLDNDYSPTVYQAEELYYCVVQKLRQKSGLDGEQRLIDPRREGIYDVLNRASTFDQNNSLKFVDEYVFRNIVDYEISNYHGLLWVLAELLIDQIKVPEEDLLDETDDDSTIEHFIGNPDLPTLTFGNATQLVADLVGHVGITREYKLITLLDRLTRNPDYEVKELAGRLLKPLARVPQHHQFIYRVLDKWLYPRRLDPFDPLLEEDDNTTDPGEFFVAATAIGHIYSYFDNHDRLHPYLLHMGAICGVYGQYEQDITEKLDLLLDLHILETRAERGEQAITEQDIEEAREANRQLVAQEMLEVSEQSVITLLVVLENLMETHPENIAHIINEWIKQGIRQIEDDDFEFDDVEIERLLSIDDSATRARIHKTMTEQRERHQRQSLLDNMAWHVGMVVAVYLFQRVQYIRTREEEDDLAKKRLAARTGGKPDDGDEDKSVVVQPDDVGKDKTPVQAKAMAGDDVGGVQDDDDDDQEDIPPADGGVADQADGGAALPQPDKLKAAVEEPPKKKRSVSRQTMRSNRLSVSRTHFPLLDLLPALLDSYEIPLSPWGFIHNLASARIVEEFFFSDKIWFSYEIPYELLITDPLREAFRAILRWYDIMAGNKENPDEEGRQQWIERVYPALLSLFNKASHGQRPVLREMLFSEGWISSRHEDIRSLSHALLARSYVLDGRVLDLPIDRYGVVLMDAGVRNYDWDSYYKSAYRLIQQLASLVPIRIYQMGSTNLLKVLGEYNQDNQLLERELRPHFTRSRLLMPFVETLPGESQPLLNVDKTHFMLALTPLEYIWADIDQDLQPDIIDMLDVLALASQSMQATDPELQRILRSSMYTEAEKEAARQKLANTGGGDWAWKDKLFVLTPDKERVRSELMHQGLYQFVEDGQPRNLSNDIEDFLTMIAVSDSTFVNDIDAIELTLSHQVTLNLHHVDRQEWLDNLQSFCSILGDNGEIPADFDPLDETSARAQLAVWIGQIGEITHAQHPRDVTMSINWTVLTIAQFNLPLAVEIVSEWLAGDDHTGIIGVASTKTLFNFYRVSPDIEDKVEAYAALLQLLPAFVKSEQGRDASEIWQLISVILMWARYSSWSAYLVSPAGGEHLQTALRSIRGRQDIANLRRLIALHEVVIGLASRYVELGIPWRDFRAMVIKATEYYSSHLSEEDINKFAAEYAGVKVSQHLSRTLLTMLHRIDTDINSFLVSPDGMEYLLDSIAGQVSTLASDSRSVLQMVEENVQAVVDSIRLQIISRGSNPMPLLPAGKRYGVILINADVRRKGRDLRSKVIGFVKHFRKSLKESGHEDEIVLTIHRIGRNEIIYNNNRTSPTQKMLRTPDGTPPFAPIISPILERYTIENVAFILIITDKPPLDLDDWRDEQEWVNRMFIQSRGVRSWINDFFASDTDRNRRLAEQIEFMTEAIIEHIGY